MPLRRYLAFLTTCGLLVTGVAHAQSTSAPLGPVMNVTGSAAPGVRLGDAMVLHLGIGAEVGWDSNVFYTSSNEKNSFYLRLSPMFDLTNRPRQGRRLIQFDFHGGLDYLEWLTGDANLRSLRQFNVNAGLQAAFFNYSPYNFVIFDNYVRSTQPPYTETSFNIDRDTNEVGLRINLSPGGGRLTFNLGYLFGIDYFEVQQLKDFDVQYHRMDLRASWKFLPKTAVYINATEIVYLYPHPGTYMHPDSYPLRVDAGLQGLITTKLTVNAWVGYANGFYVSGPNPNTAIGGLSLAWKPTILSTGTLGYEHDFVNSYLGSYFDLDQVYLSWTQLIWRFTGFLRASYANERYQGIIPNGPSAETVTGRADNYFTLNARVDYPFKDWLIGSVGYDLQANLSNGALNLGVAGLLPVNYTKHVVYLRLTLAY